jgi:photosystem II stability/assembly factor-like uncharacterized protein
MERTRWLLLVVAVAACTRKSGNDLCRPVVCTDQCGLISDGCGGVFDCGPCTDDLGTAPSTSPSTAPSTSPSTAPSTSPMPSNSPAWTEVANTKAQLTGISGTSAHDVWAVGTNPSLFHSTDGVHFNAFADPGVTPDMSLWNVFAMGSEVWMVGSLPMDPNFILHQKNGVSTRVTVPHIRSIHGVPGSLFAAGGDNDGVLYHSSDGDVWGSQLASAGPLMRVFAQSSVDAFAVGGAFGGGDVLRTGDAYQWTKLSPGNFVNYYGVWASGDEVFIAGDIGFIMHSSDHGDHWSRVPYAGSDNLKGIAGTLSDLWIIGANATILHSTDGGASFAAEVSLPVIDGTQTFVDLYVAPTGEVFVVGEKGEILKRG